MCYSVNDNDKDRNDDTSTKSDDTNTNNDDDNTNTNTNDDNHDDNNYDSALCNERIKVKWRSNVVEKDNEKAKKNQPLNYEIARERGSRG